MGPSVRWTWLPMEQAPAMDGTVTTLKSPSQESIENAVNSISKWSSGSRLIILLISSLSSKICVERRSPGNICPSLLRICLLPLRICPSPVRICLLPLRIYLFPVRIWLFSMLLWCDLLVIYWALIGPEPIFYIGVVWIY